MPRVICFENGWMGCLKVAYGRLDMSGLFLFCTEMSFALIACSCFLYYARKETNVQLNEG